MEATIASGERQGALECLLRSWWPRRSSTPPRRSRISTVDSVRSPESSPGRGRPGRAARRRSVRGDRLRVGVGRPRPVSGKGEISKGLLGLACLPEVQRQRRRQVVAPLRVQRLQCPRGPAVRHFPPAPQQAAVDRLLDHRMTEPVLGIRDRPARDQVDLEASRGPQVRVPAQHLLEQRHGELAAEDPTHRERLVRLVADAVDPGHDHLLDRGRDLPGCHGEAPAVPLTHQDAGVDEGSDQLLQIERVAFGAGQDTSPDRRGERPAPYQGFQERGPHPPAARPAAAPTLARRAGGPHRRGAATGRGRARAAP